MKVKQLDHLNLSVQSFPETADWYGRVFGFEVVEDKVDRGMRWGVIRSGDAMLCIYEHPELGFEGSDEIRDRGLHGINHFGLRITDRESWEETVKREGIEVNYGGPVRWPHSTAWYVSDPTGYEIEVALWDDDEARFD
ncbi:MAG: VOC family protein [Planctomycetota bacterium]|jgi:catechol 2,3-dioxygenase-like lactoylglutathione lyase family enzyme